MNKKGYSLSGWIEGIALVILFIGVFGVVVSRMNVQYGRDFQIGLGSQINASKSALIGYQDTSSEKITGGEAEFTTSQGLTLKSSWDIIKSVGGIVWDFISGGFIETICSYMKLDKEVALIFRVLYFISVVFAIIALLFKRTP